MSKSIQTKRCPRCKQTFPRTKQSFHKCKNKREGLQNWCKKCCRQNANQYTKEHKAEQRRYHRQYRSTIRGHLRIVWNTMLRRCNNPKRKDYKYYGGRDIKVKFACFEDFYKYVKELKVDPRGLTIDRINNNAHYKPGNIRFVTQAENNRNQRPPN